MFGAYQAGAWEILARTWAPDIVVGASIGALNGWAIAGGCDPAQLSQRWLQLRRSPGRINGRELHAIARDLQKSYQPRVRYGLVATLVPRLRPRLFTTPGITWEHLAASCAVPGVLPQIRLEGRLYTDGGLLHPLPLWAACQMGATDILAVNVLPRMPGSLLQTCVAAFRAVAPKPPGPHPEARITMLVPSDCLGTPLEAIYWRPAKIQAWIEAGREDATRLAAQL